MYYDVHWKHKILFSGWFLNNKIFLIALLDLDKNTISLHDIIKENV